MSGCNLSKYEQIYTRLVLVCTDVCSLKEHAGLIEHIIASWGKQCTMAMLQTHGIQHIAVALVDICGHAFAAQHGLSSTMCMLRSGYFQQAGCITQAADNC